MSKTHKITKLKKRIAYLEKLLNEIPTLDDKFRLSKSQTIVELNNVTLFSKENLRFIPSEEEIIRRAIGEMFDIYAHPELTQLLTCTKFISRVDPMIPDSEVIAYEVKCNIVKQTNL